MAEVYESERLTFRAVEDSDDAVLLAMHQDTEINIRCAPSPAPHGQKSAKEFREYLQETCLMATVICLPTDPSSTTSHSMVPIGTITLSDTPKKQHFRHTNLDVTIAKPYRRQGYGSEAMRWALDWAFRRAGLHKVSMWCYEYNTAALRLYEKFSILQEARLREHVWLDGRFWDDCGFSILEPEWREWSRAMSVSTAQTSPTANREWTGFQPINSSSIGNNTELQTSVSAASVASVASIASVATAVPTSSIAQMQLPQPKRFPEDQTMLRSLSQQGLGMSGRAASLPHVYHSPFEPAAKRRQKSAHVPATRSVSPGPVPARSYQAPQASQDSPVVYEYRTLKESTLTVAELWKEWHEGYPEEGRPSVEWMEETYKGNWRKKQHGAPGASCQYFSQRKRVIDEVRHLTDQGGLGSYEAAIELLDMRMKKEGMPSLNKLANELKRESGVQKRKRYDQLAIR